MSHGSAEGVGARQVLLSTASAAQVVCHARDAWPRECCGFLVGWPGRTLRVQRAVRLVNRRNDLSHESYEIDPLDWLRVERSLDPSLAVVGVYHSHPDGPCRPSASDREQAQPGLSYLIVTSHEDRCGAMRSWGMDEHGMLREESLEEVV